MAQMRPTFGESMTQERRSTWTPEEDDRLCRLVSHYGPQNWCRIAKELGTRNSKSCRSRWSNYLAPGINKGPFTAEEEACIEEKHREFGNRWSTIARFLPGRTDMSIKNYWNGHLKRKLAAEGQVSMEPSLKPRVTHMDLPTPTGAMGHAIPRVAALEPPVPSGRSSVVSHVHAESHEAKRARTATTTTPHDLYSQIPNLSVLQNCRSLPYVIALAALLVELCEDDDPDTLCKVLGIANDLLMKKKNAEASGSGKQAPNL